MAMLIAWQTTNAVRRPASKKFTIGFLVVTPGLTIRDQLRVLFPNDPDSYYASRELVPNDMISDLERAKIVVTNYHAFKQRERMELSKDGRWAFAEFTEVYRIEADFEAKVEEESAIPARHPKNSFLSYAETI